jgi:hypothetical protein
MKLPKLAMPALLTTMVASAARRAAASTSPGEVTSSRTGVTPSSVTRYGSRAAGEEGLSERQAHASVGTSDQDGRICDLHG